MGTAKDLSMNDPVYRPQRTITPLDLSFPLRKNGYVISMFFECNHCHSIVTTGIGIDKHSNHYEGFVCPQGCDLEEIGITLKI